MRIVLAGLLVFTAFLAQTNTDSLLLPHPVHLFGTVVDPVGNPIQGAWFAHANQRDGKAESDSNGLFTFETNAPYIVIEKAGYRSQRIQTSGFHDSQIKLQPFNDQFPKCGDTTSLVAVNDRVTEGLFFRKIPDIDSDKPNPGIDTITRKFTLNTSGKKYEILLGVGPMWAGLLPSNELVWKSTKFEEVAYGNEMGEIVDARGTLPDGNRWRNLGAFETSISYEDVPLAVAVIFDKLLDSACWKPMQLEPASTP
ncbi:MAG TPA: carboxypeptidase-like regulatory domain-containing protein [Terracidiphilus sp.]|nr:carboxypeptidase-like regulatory domain-containing protein [Terracidiphilus sp.]